MSEQITALKCSKCHKEKPLSAFYKREGGYMGRLSWCKECHKKIMRGQRHKQRQEAGHESEAIAIMALKARGIYATTGKCSEWRQIDVVAWGNVRIEVKLGTWYEEQRAFRFALGRKTKERWHDCDLVLLICDWPNGPRTFHLFETSERFWFHEDGTLKTGIMWTPRASVLHTNGASLTDEDMRKGKDAWGLIEAYRKYRAGR